MKIKAKTIIKELENLAYPFLACDWDNSGLQVGNVEQDINNILLTLDITEEVLEEAVNRECDLIIAHHPLIFSDLKTINRQTKTGRIIMDAIKKDIIIYAAHTTLDIAPGGLNDYLASRLSINNLRPIEVTDTEKYYKLNVYIPEGYYEQIKSVLLDNGAGQIGNYSHSSFSSKGTSTFKPLTGSNPHRGEIEKECQFSEMKLSTVVSARNLNKVLAILHEVHPYEEVAYDLFSLTNLKKEFGIGRVGDLEEEMRIMQFIKLIKKILNREKLMVVGPFKEKIKRIALCTGAGSDYIKSAADEGADLYLTGEVKYHDAQLAEELNMTLINAGHYSTEAIVKELLEEYLRSKFKDIKIIKSKINTDPWQNV